MPSGTVHLWKFRNMASKGYIHCTCRINLRKWKYRFTLIESLPNPDNSNSYRTPHRKHWSTVRISEWLHDCTTLFFQKTWLLGSSILNHRNSRLDPCVSRLDPRISKLKAVALRDTRIESQVSSFEYRLTFEQYCIFSRFKEPGSLQFSLEHRIVWGLGTTQNSPKIHMNYRGQLMKFLHT